MASQTVLSIRKRNEYSYTHNPCRHTHGIRPRRFSENTLRQHSHLRCEPSLPSAAKDCGVGSERQELVPLGAAGCAVDHPDHAWRRITSCHIALAADSFHCPSFFSS